MGLLTPGWSLGALTPSALARFSSLDFPPRQAFAGPMATPAHTSTGSPERHPVPSPIRREPLFLTLHSGRSGAHAGLTGTGWWGRAWGGTPVGTSQGTPSRGAGVCLQRPPGGTGRPCPQPKPPFRPSSGQQVKRGVPGEKERRTQERKANPGQSGAGGSEGRPQPAHCPRPPRPPPAELPGRL